MFWELSSEYFTSLLIFAAVLLFFLSLRSIRRPYGIPPGPPLYFPFLGHFVEYSRNSSNREANQARLRHWRKQYGDVFSIFFGSQLVIVLYGYDTIKEAFVTNGDVFSERPRMFITDKFAKGKGIAFSSGHMWKEQRSFAVDVLRNFGFGKTSFQEKIQEELSIFLNTILAENGQPFNTKKSISISIANIICSILFGHRFEHGDARFQNFMDAIDENFKLLRASGVISSFPFLQYLPGDLFKYHRVFDNQAKIQSFCREVIREHVQSFDENDIRDFTGAYIKKMKDCDVISESNSFDEDNLIRVLEDLFVAGMETTTTTLQWLIAYVINYPHYQERIQAELDINVGRTRLPNMQDKPNLSLSEAFVLEVMRISPIAPITLPHSTATDVMFRGYRIPRGAIMMPVADSVFRDPNLWDSPNEFRPERFLDESGNVHKPEYHMPFSIGRRVCLGESLAKMELFLFFTSMLQRFRFLPAERGEAPSLEGVQGFTYAPKPYCLRAVVRT